MAKPKLTNEQRVTLLGWLAADYDWRLIVQWFEEREWPVVSKQTVYYYREQAREEITALRAARREGALTTGLALKEERVARLAQHADELDAIKWVPDPKTGKLHNEKAWRETLDDIASEVGGRVQKQDVVGAVTLKVVYGTDDNAT
jgi:hypothetical protein